MIWKTKKGSYIMEAAIVLPFIMLATITSILIIMFFYSQMTEQSKLHVALRHEAGRMTEQTRYLHGGALQTEVDAELYRDEGAFGGKVYGKKYLVMSHKGILNRKGTFTVEGESYGTDGAEYVRYWNLVKGVANDT